MPRTQHSDKSAGIEMWKQTGERRWTRTDGEPDVVRIREHFPVTSAEDFNLAQHTEAPGEFSVLHHDRPLPSKPHVVAEVDELDAALEAATEFMEAH